MAQRNNQNNNENKRKNRTNYKLSFKLKVVSYYKSCKNFSKTAKKFNLLRKSIRFWFNQEDKIRETINKLSRTKITWTKRSSKFPEMEIDLYNWIIEQRNNGACVSGRMIREQAKILNPNPTFLASNGWLVRFFDRHKLVLRRITSSGRELPPNSRQIVDKFHNECAEKFCHLPDSWIINMDETAIYLDSPNNYTYDNQEYVGSYVKVPAYEVCLANTTADHLDCELAAAAGLNRESTESALTRASFKLGTVNEFSTSRLILDHPHHHHHHHLQLQLQQPPHYYETLSAPNNHNHKHLLTSNYNGDYHVYNSMLSHGAPNSSANKFDSIVVLPTSKLFASAANGPLTSSTVVLLKSSALTNDQQCELDYKLNQQQQQQQYSTLVYGDLSSSSTSSSSSPTTISSSSTSSNQPLITFVAGSSAI